MADTLELIKALPLELRERILKEYIKIKLWQRKMLGWDEVQIQKGYTKMKLKQRKALGWDQVHEALELAPYCRHNEQIVNVLFCYKCNRSRCPLNYLCNLCTEMDSCTISSTPLLMKTITTSAFKKSFYAGWRVVA